MVCYANTDIHRPMSFHPFVCRLDFHTTKQLLVVQLAIHSPIDECQFEQMCSPTLADICSHKSTIRRPWKLDLRRTMKFNNWKEEQKTRKVFKFDRMFCRTFCSTWKVFCLVFSVPYSVEQWRSVTDFHVVRNVRSTIYCFRSRIFQYTCAQTIPERAWTKLNSYLNFIIIIE